MVACIEMAPWKQGLATELISTWLKVVGPLRKMWEILNSLALHSTGLMLIGWTPTVHHKGQAVHGTPGRNCLSDCRAPHAYLSNLYSCDARFLKL